MAVDRVSFGGWPNNLRLANDHAELIITLDGFARGQRSPGYYGYFGSDVANWITTNTAIPHRMLIGRRTYEMLHGLPAEARDSINRIIFDATIETCARYGRELIEQFAGPDIARKPLTDSELVKLAIVISQGATEMESA